MNTRSVLVSLMILAVLVPVLTAACPPRGTVVEEKAATIRVTKVVLIPASLPANSKVVANADDSIDFVIPLGVNDKDEMTIKPPQGYQYCSASVDGRAKITLETNEKGVVTQIGLLRQQAHGNIFAVAHFVPVP